MSPTGCACCQAPCDCPACDGCCQCLTWQQFFDFFSDGGTGYYLKPQDDLSIYDGLDRSGVCGLTRLYASQQDCLDAFWAGQAALAAEYCESLCGDDQACYDQCIADYPPYPNDPTADGEPCGEVYYAGFTLGWSAPLINGQPATPEMLAELCPNGANPPDLTGDGLTHYAGVPYWTGSTYAIPDIHRLVFKTGATAGDPIADALFERGIRNDLPDLPWEEADDCGSCDTPPAYEYDCNPATDSKRFYSKTVEIDTTSLNFCPPQDCKEVTITVSRTDKCNTPDVVTEWKAIVYICPCLAAPFFGEDAGTGDLWEAAYGYESEAECIADLGVPSCEGDQWKQVRHQVGDYPVDRVPMETACDPSGGAC
jgi:hypothetical protein